MESDGMLGTPVRLLVVDACSPYRDGLRATFGREPGVRIVADAGTVAETLSLAALADYDVALVDICLPDGSGIELCSQLTRERPERRVILQSLFDWDVYLAGAWAAGAAGFLPKHTDPRALLLVVYRARLRELYSSEQLRRVMAFQSTVGERLSRLAERERAVMRLLALGQSNREMGERLGLSENTIEKHVSSLLERMGVRSRTALLSMILRYRLDVIQEPAEWRIPATDWWWIPVPMAPVTNDNDALTEP